MKPLNEFEPGDVMTTPLIAPPPEAPEKRTVNVRLEEEVFENLRRYVAYSGRGDFSHVINNAMRYVFLKDTGFQAWLTAHPTPITETTRKKRHTKPLQQTKGSAHDDAPTEAPDLVAPRESVLEAKGASANARS